MDGDAIGLFPAEPCRNGTGRLCLTTRRPREAEMEARLHGTFGPPRRTSRAWNRSAYDPHTTPARPAVEAARLFEAAVSRPARGTATASTSNPAVRWSPASRPDSPPRVCGVRGRRSVSSYVPYLHRPGPRASPATGHAPLAPTETLPDHALYECMDLLRPGAGWAGRPMMCNTRPVQVLWMLGTRGAWTAR